MHFLVGEDRGRTGFEPVLHCAHSCRDSQTTLPSRLFVGSKPTDESIRAISSVTFVEGADNSLVGDVSFHLYYDFFVVTSHGKESEEGESLSYSNLGVE